MLVFLLVIAVAAAFALVLAGGGDRAKRSLFLRRTALAAMSVSTALIGLFIASEALTDPGGWRATALVSAWLVPLAALSVLAWYRPAWAGAVLGAAVAGAAALAIWFAVDPGGLRAFEDHTGPVRAVLTVVLAMPVTLFGWHRPISGAVMLLVLAMVPPAVSLIGSSHGEPSLLAVSTVPVFAGLLYLAAGPLSPRPGTSSPTGPRSRAATGPR